MDVRVDVEAAVLMVVLEPVPMDAVTTVRMDAILHVLEHAVMDVILDVKEIVNQLAPLNVHPHVLDLVLDNAMDQHHFLYR